MRKLLLALTAATAIVSSPARAQHPAKPIRYEANRFTVGLAAMPISALWMTGGPSHPHSSPGDENQRGVFDVQGLRR
jgi:hypothetical protein